MNKVYNQKIFANRLGELMKENSDTVYTIAEYLHLSASTISRYLNCEINPKITAIESLSIKYGVNPAWLMGGNIEKYYDLGKYKNKKIPIYGAIAAGKPVLADEHIEGYEHVEYNADLDFCLRVKGDSMINACIYDGDMVFIRKQSTVENGEIAAIIIDEEKVTLKRVYKVKGAIILRPENPQYEDFVFAEKDMKSVRILGKAIYFKSEVK